MINVIHGVGTNGFDAIIYPDQPLINQQYFQNQISTFSNTLNDFGRQFMEAARDAYQAINNSEAVHMAKVAIRAAKGIFKTNQIMPLNDLVDFQAATPTMQRWVMACPEVREMYHKQRCDGYSDSYVDMHPGFMRDDHYDYRRVMDGVIEATDDSWSVKFYPDDLLEGDRELDHHEKSMILDTWATARLFMDGAKADPTNPFGGKL